MLHRSSFVSPCRSWSVSLPFFHEATACFHLFCQTLLSMDWITNWSIEASLVTSAFKPKIFDRRQVTSFSTCSRFIKKYLKASSCLSWRFLVQYRTEALSLLSVQDQKIRTVFLLLLFECLWTTSFAFQQITSRHQDRFSSLEACLLASPQLITVRSQQLLRQHHITPFIETLLCCFRRTKKLTFRQNSLLFTSIRCSFRHLWSLSTRHLSRWSETELCCLTFFAIAR